MHRRYCSLALSHEMCNLAFQIYVLHYALTTLSFQISCFLYCEKSISFQGNCDTGTILCRPLCVQQWETTLWCNVVSHWLGTYTKWSLWQYDSCWCPGFLHCHIINSHDVEYVKSGFQQYMTLHNWEAMQIHILAKLGNDANTYLCFLKTFNKFYGRVNAYIY